MATAYHEKQQSALVGSPIWEDGGTSKAVLIQVYKRSESHME